ncbi:hypothetical protein K488DRAFT_81960 [Vararia minispora EC-137]|uniref:Uncharacterized protein n=1 Tax=Vararia minispora EC-137 TaxID=1314806 RepID=A0ACB8QYT2_9AGAM|nr:hypothetical protein K488DRAFT_81960 [Vararia minispora EC-137]
MTGSPIVPIVHGPILIGTVFNVLLYGISLTQTAFYASHFKGDKWFMKALVFLVFVADTANVVFDITYIYNSLVNNYYNPDAIANANWIFATDPAMTSIVASMVQMFFTWRVRVLTGNNLVAILLLAGSIVSGLGGIATSIAIGIVPDWLEFQRFEAPVIVWLVTSAVVDVTITFFLTWHLRKHRTGFQKRTDDALEKIIRMTVQTGLITSVWAIVDLIVFLAIPTGIHLIFNFPLGKLYSNSLLSSLNARSGWQYSTGTSEGANQGPNGVPLGKTNVNGRLVPDQMVSFTQTVRPEVFIAVESHEMSDRIDSKTEVYDGSQTYYHARKVDDA